MALTLVAFISAAVLRFGPDETLRMWLPRYLPYLLFATIGTPVIFLASGLYRRIWRYASTTELIAIARSTTFVALGVLAFGLGAERYLDVEPLSVGLIVIFYLVQTAFIGGIRFSIRVAAERSLPQQLAQPQRKRRRVLLVGVNRTGQRLADEMMRAATGFVPVGYLDADPGLRGRFIGRLPVLGSPAETAEIANGWEISEIIIAVPSAPGSLVQQVVAGAERAHCRVLTMPSLAEVLLRGSSADILRRVETEDLLRRQSVKIDVDLLRQAISGRRIMVTGAAGSIGTELVKQIAALGPTELVAYDRSELGLFHLLRNLEELSAKPRIKAELGDIRDRKRLHSVLAQERPAIVFHAAAYKHVPLMEGHPIEAVINNVLATASLIEECADTGVPQFVLISTDKAVRPVSVMGASKRLCELLVREAPFRPLGVNVSGVRFGNVLGSSGSVVPLIESQIHAGGPVTITDRAMTRYFMTIPEAAQLVAEAAAIAETGQIFVLDMGEPVKIVDLATQLIQTLAPDEDIEIIYTGSRPGEKLHEELTAPHETKSRVGHSDIWRVDDPQIVEPHTWRALPELWDLTSNQDALGVRRRLYDLASARELSLDGAGVSANVAEK